MSTRVLLLLAAAAFLGCGQKSSEQTSASAPTTDSPATVAAPVGSTGKAGAAWGASNANTAKPAQGAAPTAAAAAGEDPILAALKGRPQKADTQPSETVRDAGGVFVGLPKGWITDDTNKIDPTLGYGANLGGCLMFQPPKSSAAARTDSHARLCAVTSPSLPELSGRAKASLELYGFYLNIDKATWTPWVDGTVGDGLKAKISRGSKGDKEAFAAHVEVPGKKSLLVVGRWANDEEKEAVFEIVRGIGSCTFSADKRKCSPDKPYR